jgi:predicted dehydrogenase
MKIALVGLGTAGCDIHLPALARIHTASVVGLCDRDEARRNRAAGIIGAATFADFDAMMAATRPDVVLVGTPPDSHADYCLRSLNAGAHVLCEKPFVSSVAEADAVLDAAARAGRRIALNHEFREMPIFRAVRDQVTGPGTPPLKFVQVWQLMDFPPHKETDWRGRLVQRTLFEGGVHLIDLAMTLFGETPVSVQAATYAEQRPATDAVVTATLEFSGGRLAQLTQNRLCKGETQYFEVRADTPEASLRASFGGRARVSAGLMRSATPRVRLEFGHSGLAWKEQGSRRTFLARNPKHPTVVATQAVFEQTLAAFEHGAEPPISGRVGREILRVIVACYHSAASGRRVRLDDPLMDSLATTRMGA